MSGHTIRKGYIAPTKVCFIRPGNSCAKKGIGLGSIGDGHGKRKVVEACEELGASAVEMELTLNHDNLSFKSNSGQSL